MVAGVTAVRHMKAGIYEREDCSASVVCFARCDIPVARAVSVQRLNVICATRAPYVLINARVVVIAGYLGVAGIRSTAAIPNGRCTTVSLCRGRGR
jgi:hypothetical protein